MSARTPVERFWELVSPEPNTGCWFWAGPGDGRGYGSCWSGQRQAKAHRFSWELTNGAIPAGMFICHHCDQPACVNPAHLFLGSNYDNIFDCIAKGRRSPQEGEHNGRARLTADAVRRIRALAPTHRRMDLAVMFGVSGQAISDVVLGRKWRHVAQEGARP